MNRFLKRAVPLLCALALCTVPAGAAAPETAPAPEQEPEELTGAGALIEAFLEENEIPRDQIAVGYLNTLTGEEYCVNGDKYFFGASLYKVALNMYYEEKVAAGEYAWDDMIDGFTVERLMERSLIRSDNGCAASLLYELGSVEDFRLATAGYYGMTEEEAAAEPEYLHNFWVTPAQMLQCLRTLYEGRETYPKVIDCMLQAQPGNYLRLREDRWTIAQKYGYYVMDARYTSAAGIVYTDTPFLLVVMCRTVKQPKEQMSRLCSLLGEYTESCAPAEELSEETPEEAPEA